MSFKAVTLVYERTRAKGGSLQALVSIADHAHDDGRHAFPSPATIAWKSRQTRRWAERILEKLVTDGEIWPRWDPVAKRLYLDIRCICHWDAYRQEGPIPTREGPERARTIREDFAHKLVAAASARAEGERVSDNTLRDNPGTLRDKSDTLGERAAVENSPSDGTAETSPPQPSGTVNDPSLERSEEKAGAAPRLIDWPDENVAVITKLAHEVLDRFPRADEGDIAEAVKTRCATLRIAYRSDVVRKALDSAKWQREHPGGVH